MANKFKAGDEVITNNKIPKNIGSGRIGIVQRTSYNGYGVEYIVIFNDEPERNYGIISTHLDFKIGGNSNLMKERLLREKKSHIDKIKELESLIKEIDNKIDYIENTGSDNFVIKEYKAYQISIITENKDLSDKQRREKILELL